MGSLMAGWSTAPAHADEVFKRSNSSLTKDEVEKFWKMKRLVMEEHLEEATRDASDSPKTPVAIVIPEEVQSEEAATVTTNLPAMGTSPGWWTRSNSAFLNDPPAAQSKESNYVPQFDIALKGQMAQDK